MQTATVTVFGTGYLWREGEGLAPEAVLSLEGWIVTLAGHYSARGQRRGVSFDDLVQAGTLGALGAAKRYDPRQGTKFITYATFSIRAAMQAAVRGRELESLDELGEAGFEAAAPPDSVDREAAAEEAEMCLALAPRGEKTLLRCRFGLNGGRPYSLNALAKHYGCSASAINARINNTLSTIRRLSL
jgi:RNA polymerase sigma factor (sigma-70 family)